jgi:hypothetical protein
MDNVLANENNGVMATLTTTPSALTVTLSRFEKFFGMLRDRTFPRSAVTAVELCPEGLHAVRGLRAPGLGLPGVRLVGTWRRRGAKSLVSVRGGQPAVRVTLTGVLLEQLQRVPAALTLGLQPRAERVELRLARGERRQQRYVGVDDGLDEGRPVGGQRGVPGVGHLVGVVDGDAPEAEQLGVPGVREVRQ